uniref:Uncharacterized protein n=1 Tax=Nomascus leucogenys TaxID=61853 RepID=A0A2I3H488_NOMLE
MMALKVVREILEAEQTLPVPLRSNQAKSTLSPFQGASSTLAQIWRVMSRAFQNLLYSWISAPV